MVEQNGSQVASSICASGTSQGQTAISSNNSESIANIITKAAMQRQQRQATAKSEAMPMTTEQATVAAVAIKRSTRKQLPQLFLLLVILLPYAVPAVTNLLLPARSLQAVEEMIEENGQQQKSSGNEMQQQQAPRVTKLKQWVSAMNESVDEKSIEAFSEINEQAGVRNLVFESQILTQEQLSERFILYNMTRRYEGDLYAWKNGHLVIMQNETTILVVCASIPRYYYWEFAQTASALVIFCMIVVGNLSVLHRLKSCRRRRSNVNYFIVQLAIADLFVGFFSVTQDSLWRLQKMFAYGPVACRASKYISVLFIYSSTYLLVALSIDRWEAVVKPLAFTQNRSRGYYLVLGAWILAFVSATPVTLYTTIKDVEGLPQCFIELDQRGWKIYMVYLTCSLLIMPALIIAICYTHIVFTIWSKGRMVQQQQKCKLREEEMTRHRHKHHGLAEAIADGGRGSNNNDLVAVALESSDTTATTKLGSRNDQTQEQQRQQQKQQQQQSKAQRRQLQHQQQSLVGDSGASEGKDDKDNDKQAHVRSEIVPNYDEDLQSQFTEDEYMSSLDEEEDCDYDDDDEEQENKEDKGEIRVGAEEATNGLVGCGKREIDSDHDNGLEVSKMVAGQVASGDKHANQEVSVGIRPPSEKGGSRRIPSDHSYDCDNNSNNPAQGEPKGAKKVTTTGRVPAKRSSNSRKVRSAHAVALLADEEPAQVVVATAALKAKAKTTTTIAPLEPKAAVAAAITTTITAFAVPVAACRGVSTSQRKRLSKSARKVRRCYAGQQHGSGVIPKARIKTIKMTLVIVAVFILCWAPFYIINLCSVFGLVRKDTPFAFAIKTLSQSLAHLNSAVNPIIFWMFSSRQHGSAVVVSSGESRSASSRRYGTGSASGGVISLFGNHRLTLWTSFKRLLRCQSFCCCSQYCRCFCCCRHRPINSSSSSNKQQLQHLNHQKQQLR